MPNLRDCYPVTPVSAPPLAIASERVFSMSPLAQGAVTGDKWGVQRGDPARRIPMLDDRVQGACLVSRVETVGVSKRKGQRDRRDAFVARPVGSLTCTINSAPNRDRFRASALPPRALYQTLCEHSSFVLKNFDHHPNHIPSNPALPLAAWYHRPRRVGQLAGVRGEGYTAPRRDPGSSVRVRYEADLWRRADALRLTEYKREHLSLEAFGGR
jgi:hypothetical protein